MTQTTTLSPEYVLLGLLSQQPAHGYDLHHRLIEELGQIWHISLSQTYNILKRLEAKGFIVGVVQAQEKAPPRRRFRLTTLGRRRFEEWLGAATEPRARAIRVEFLTRLYFTYIADPGAARSLIEFQIADTRAGIARLTTVLAELPPDQTFNQLGLDLRLRQLTSVLDWLAECRAILGFEP
ncbi:MAG: PadR family transcriptional regulator [Chloroflexi bacterium]|nr:PadR family transcriptional regulator [Chloroflexota bacterium]